jgi:hypothetical protein
MADLYLFLSLPLAVALTPFAQTNPSPSAVSYDDSEAYAVYAAVLANDPLVTQANPKLLVVRRETEAYQLCEGWDTAAQPLFGSSLADYQAKAKTTWLLRRTPKSSLPSVIATTAEITSSSKSNDPTPNAFERKYPDSHGYVVFSAVGFNADKSVAVVSRAFVSYGASSQSSSGGFLVLQRKDGRWQPADWLHMGCAWGSSGGIIY